LAAHLVLEAGRDANHREKPENCPAAATALVEAVAFGPRL